MAGDLLGKRSGTTQINSSQSPWPVQQPYLTDVFSQAQGLYNKGAYSGPFAGQSNPYSQMAQQYATDPNSLTAQSGNQLSSTISGQYLSPDSNPYLRASVEDALGLAGSAFAKQYGGAAGNNLGNSGYQESLARGLGAVATNAYSGAYGQERQNQLNAAAIAPGVDQQRLAALYGADARTQLEAQAQQQAYMSPWSNLANYRNAIAGNYGATATTEQPYFNNQAANALGLGLSGMQAYGLGKDFGWWGV